MTTRPFRVSEFLRRLKLLPSASFLIIVLMTEVSIGTNVFGDDAKISASSQANPKAKALVLYIHETNWDDIKMDFGTVKRVMWPPLTKSQELAKYKEYLGLTTTTDRVLKYVEQLIKPGIAIAVDYEISYLKNLDMLNDSDRVDPYVGRGGVVRLIYPIGSIPGVIPAENPPFQDIESYVREMSKFKYVRQMADIRIKNVDAQGTVYLEYLGEQYICKKGESVKLPALHKQFPALDFLWDNPNHFKNDVLLSTPHHLSTSTDLFKMYYSKNNLLAPADVWKNKIFNIRTETSITNLGFVDDY